MTAATATNPMAFRVVAIVQANAPMSAASVVRCYRRVYGNATGVARFLAASQADGSIVLAGRP